MVPWKRKREGYGVDVVDVGISFWATGACGEEFDSVVGRRKVWFGKGGPT